jgi:opacity protein-like surface antigen
VLYDYDLHWNAHLRGVLGFAHGSFKPFVAGGLALAGFDVTEYGLPVGGTYVGWSLGGGVDVRFTEKIIGRAEVLYDDYGAKSYDDFDAGLSGWTARLAIICDLGR